MNEEEMRKRSSEKVKQVLGLMKALHLRYEIKEHISEEGFIEKTLFWIDEEKYPVAVRPEETLTQPKPTENDTKDSEQAAPEADKEEDATSV